MYLTSGMERGSVVNELVWKSWVLITNYTTSKQSIQEPIHTSSQPISTNVCRVRVKTKSKSRWKKRRRNWRQIRRLFNRFRMCLRMWLMDLSLWFIIRIMCPRIWDIICPMYPRMWDIICPMRPRMWDIICPMCPKIRTTCPKIRTLSQWSCAKPDYRRNLTSRR